MTSSKIVSISCYEKKIQYIKGVKMEVYGSVVIHTIELILTFYHYNNLRIISSYKNRH